MSQRASSSSSGTTQFTFVSGNTQSEARSHAMREHWKRRHKHNQETKSNHRRKSSRALLPRSKNGDISPPKSNNSPEWEHDLVDNREKDTSIPAQLLCGMSSALSSSSSRPDPFQTCPVHLTSQNQRLLHHCAYEKSSQWCSWKLAWLTGL